jgi:hypothetical protein
MTLMVKINRDILRYVIDEKNIGIFFIVDDVSSGLV